jgi:hypothetical protein
VKSSWNEMAVPVTIYVTVPDVSLATPALTREGNADRMVRTILRAGISEAVPHPLWDVHYDVGDAYETNEPDQPVAGQYERML